MKYLRKTDKTFIPPHVIVLYQDGGEMGAPAGMQEDPMQQLLMMADQAVAQQDCGAAMDVCQGFIELVMSAQGAAEAPMEEPPAEPMP